MATLLLKAHILAINLYLTRLIGITSFKSREWWAVPLLRNFLRLLRLKKELNQSLKANAKDYPLLHSSKTTAAALRIKNFKGEPPLIKYLAVMIVSKNLIMRITRLIHEAYRDTSKRRMRHR
jgi:hypothetical protein